MPLTPLLLWAVARSAVARASPPGLHSRRVAIQAATDWILAVGTDGRLWQHAETEAQSDSPGAS